MKAYRVGRDYLKRAVLCYNLGRWKFERSIRLCMEFKVTWNKSARRNKMLPSAVAKFDFQLCRSRNDGNKVLRKAESSSSDA